MFGVWRVLLLTVVELLLLKMFWCCWCCCWATAAAIEVLIGGGFGLFLCTRDGDDPELVVVAAAVVVAADCDVCCWPFDDCKSFANVVDDVFAAVNVELEETSRLPESIWIVVRGLAWFGEALVDEADDLWLAEALE